MLSVVNNQIISDMDSEDDDNSLMEPALAVLEGCADAFDLNVPQQLAMNICAEEEAKKCPKVVVSSLDTSKYKSKQTVKVQKMIRFKSLLAKKAVQLSNVTLPMHTDAESWCRLCFGRLQLKTIPEAGTNGSTEVQRLQNDGTGTPPLLSIVARMDQSTVVKVLEYHVNWLEATGFTHKQGQWFYSLLSVLLKPLSPESCSCLRQLARISSIIRATLPSPEDPVLQELNLLICLVAHYFDQLDLWDKT